MIFLIDKFFVRIIIIDFLKLIDFFDLTFNASTFSLNKFKRFKSSKLLRSRNFKSSLTSYFNTFAIVNELQNRIRVWNTFRDICNHCAFRTFILITKYSIFTTFCVNSTFQTHWVLSIFTLLSTITNIVSKIQTFETFLLLNISNVLRKMKTLVVHNFSIYSIEYKYYSFTSNILLFDINTFEFDRIFLTQFS